MPLGVFLCGHEDAEHSCRIPSKHARASFRGVAVILGVLLLLVLIAAALAWHPESVREAGSRLLAMDVLLLLAYGATGFWVYFDTRPDLVTALRVGARAGVLVGAVPIANHVVELFVPARPFLVIIAPVLFMIGLLETAGSATWQRTGRLPWGRQAGYGARSWRC